MPVALLRRASFALVVLAVSLLPAAAQGPPAFTMPEASPAAAVSQTVGVTTMTVGYHRPAVKGRTIWGDLVPYGEVWRAGANENTTITFGSAVTVEGQPLAAGTYGLHTIPTATTWTVAFSRMADAWGSFSYDQAEDALRVTVQPEPAPFQERLSYTFDEPSDDAVVLALRWEKLRVPVRIAVDVPSAVLASLRRELRGLPRFFWQGWSTAAAYSAAHGGDVDEALGWADRSLAIATNFTNLRVKADLLDKKGDTAGAKGLREQARGLATEAEMNNLGYQQLAAGKTADAIATFRQNVTAHPESWNANDSLGEALAAAGNTKEAIAAYQKALAMVKDETQKTRIQGAIAKLRG
jgi:tetratricopeptide (TPR) repeat protein